MLDDLCYLDMGVSDKYEYVSNIVTLCFFLSYNIYLEGRTSILMSIVYLLENEELGQHN